MKRFFGWLGVLLLAILLIAILVGPSPWTRAWIFRVVGQETFMTWRGIAEYAGYLSDLLLILLFGGVIFLEGFGRRVSAALASIQTRNDKAWQKALSEAKADADGLISLSIKLASQGRLTYKECVACLATTSRLNLTLYSPLTLIRAAAKILTCVPNGLYGTFAMALLLIKIVSDITVMLAGT